MVLSPASTDPMIRESTIQDLIILFLLSHPLISDLSLGNALDIPFPRDPSFLPRLSRYVGSWPSATMLLPLDNNLNARLKRPLKHVGFQNLDSLSRTEIEHHFGCFRNVKGGLLSIELANLSIESALAIIPMLSGYLGSVETFSATFHDEVRPLIDISIVAKYSICLLNDSAEHKTGQFPTSYSSIRNSHPFQQYQNASILPRHVELVMRNPRIDGSRH